MGTSFNLKNLNPGTWFKFDPNDPKSGEICIRTCGIDDIKEIRKQTIKTKRVFRDGKVYVDEEPNLDLQNEMTWDKCIVDWKNFEDEGVVFPCTKENKMLLMGQSIPFAKRVTECITELSKSENEIEEIIEKN